MKKGRIITFVSIFMICGGLFSTIVLEEGLASRISEIVTVATAVVGAIALFLQFKRDKSINEASFMLEYWKAFSENDKLIVIQNKCDADMSSKKTHFTEDDYDGIVTYAQWLEALCATIKRDILSFDFINDMYSYIFFVFVNNKYIQKRELLPNLEYYRGIVEVYGLWTKYLCKHGKKIMLEENALDKAISKYNEK